MINFEIIEKSGGIILNVKNECSTQDLQKTILSKVCIHPEDYYLLSNGRKLNLGLGNATISPNNKIHVIPRILGGKGGFGSMLRAIGAQIEKTTNREACRDLSGRRLRDINEEKRLKNWISQQAEREKEAKQRKQKKLEKLCEQPKFEFKDEEYDKEREALPERVEDAVLKGLEASASTSGSSRKRKNAEKPDTKKKRKLWVDSELDDELSSSDNNSDTEESSKNVSGSDSKPEEQSSDSNPEKDEENSTNNYESQTGSKVEETPIKEKEEDLKA